MEIYDSDDFVYLFGIEESPPTTKREYLRHMLTRNNKSIEEIHVRPYVLQQLEAKVKYHQEIRRQHTGVEFVVAEGWRIQDQE